MRKHSSISKAASYREIGDYWDTHDTVASAVKGRDADMVFHIGRQVTYCALDNGLSRRLVQAARRHGVSSDTLVNMWLSERLQEEGAR